MHLVSTLGIDLAKNTFSVHGVNSNGAAVLRRTVSRRRLTELVTQLSACLIGMEACSGAHEWARRFSGCGHTVKLMAPKFVAPYRKSGQNDDNDAEAICEAVSQPNMRLVPVKSVQQQADLSLHRLRQGFIEARTATLNRIRGLLAEFGHVLALSREIFGVSVAHWTVLVATLSDSIRIAGSDIQYCHQAHQSNRAQALSLAQHQCVVRRHSLATHHFLTL